MGPSPFQSVLDAHAGRVYGLLLAAVGRDGVDDCFQETWLAALRAYPRLPRDANVRAWLMVIAERKAIDWHRARKRRPPSLADPPDSPGSADPPAEQEEALWQAVRALPDKQRAAIVYRFVGDLSYREMGELLGCSEDAARKNVHEGLRKLRSTQDWSGAEEVTRP